MKTPEIITRLDAAAVMLREHEQYNDDPECNGEGLAADACDDAAALIKYLVSVLEEAKEWTLDDEQTIHDHGNPTMDDGNLFLCAETCNERFHTIREAIAKATQQQSLF